MFYLLYPSQGEASTTLRRLPQSLAGDLDLNGDGKPALIYGGDGYVRYAKPTPQNPTGTWIVHNVSEQGYETAHGIGVGDINGDGRG